MFVKNFNRFNVQRMPVPYLDCNATTPIEPEVWEIFSRYTLEEYGNEGSRTHEWGNRAKQAVQKARDQVAAVVNATRDEVIFTSGATESNNLALLGLEAHGHAVGKRHVITTEIEHKAVLEPIRELEKRGFEVTRLRCDPSGQISPTDLAEALRDDTLLVSIMHLNNETGIYQPISEIAKLVADHSAYFHTDAAQGFGKDLETLKHPRLDLISISGHKLFAPKGIGSLITRRRGYTRAPLQPLMFGGGQERNLRPGTLPVALIAALGAASEIAVRDHTKRKAACLRFREQAWTALSQLHPIVTGDQSKVASHVLNFAIPGIDSEALIVALKDLAAFSNGSACTSQSYTPSHVLKAMGMTDDEANSCVRLSWSHLTPSVNWNSIVERIESLR